MILNDLPNVTLIQIFEHLSYEEIAKKRLVCKKIDVICQHLLNCGFNKVVRQHAVSLKRIKALLPRRESERRNHCLARHADILTCIETRISMLSMTYSKYMDLNLCCFIPGRVLDEVFRILGLIEKTNKPLRPHEVLQELRDISSMAIEHFDEKIAGSLKKSFVESNSKIYTSMENSENPSVSQLLATGETSFANSSGWNSSLNTTLNSTNSLMSSRCCESIRQRVNSLLALSRPTNPSLHLLGKAQLSSTSGCNSSNITHASIEAHGCPESRATMTYFKKLELEYKKGIVKIHRMQQIQTNQTRRIRQSMTLVTELNVQMVELKKRIEDVDAKNRELSANIKRINAGGEGTTVPSSSATSVVVPAVNTLNEESAFKRRIDDTISHSSSAHLTALDGDNAFAKKPKVE